MHEESPSPLHYLHSVAYGASGSKSPCLIAGQYGGTSQYLPNTATTKGALVIGTNADSIAGKSRCRNYVTFIDTAAAATGQYRITFNVSDYQSTGPNTPLLFHLFGGSGTGKFSLSFAITEAGKPGDYLALVWSQLKLRGEGVIPSMSP